MPSHPRVAILGLNYTPEPTGISPYTTSFARGLHEEGFPVRVLTAHPHYPEWMLREGYGQWVRRERIDDVSVTRYRHYLPKTPTGVRRLLSEISFGMRLLIARWGRPDVVVMVSPALFSSALALLRARLSRRNPATVVWVQDLYSLGITETGAGGGMVAKVMTWVESATLKSADSVVVIHHRFARYVQETLGVAPERITVVRNWTHLAPVPELDLAATREQHGWSGDETVVLHAGNMGAKQGLENVVDAARLADEQQLPLRFVLLGNGSQRDTLLERAQGVERLQFLDSLDDGGFQAALGAADVLLVNEKPGVSEMAVPSKLTSYFNTGRPVVAATDPSGVTAEEVRSAGAGVVVQAGKPQELIDACLRLRKDREAAARYGQNGQEYRSRVLSQEAALTQFAALIREKASGRNG